MVIFQPDFARIFLTRLWNALNDGDLLLIGFDLKKEIALLNDAYSDPHGITRDFNLNLLHRINNELNGNFIIENFSHHTLYNPNISAMESYLICTQRQQVYIGELERTFDFADYEAIHTEYSYKYNTDDVENMAEKSGFRILENFFDSKGHFLDSLWQVVK